MVFEKANFQGVFVISSEAVPDGRGCFARTFCAREFGAHKLETKPVQCSISSNRARGTLRGLHYQSEPHSETKLVRCIRGAIYDVIVDLRPASPTFMKWMALELNERGLASLYIPAGVAHGFQTLEDDTAVVYQIFQYYVPDAARGIRWNDPAIGVKWPLTPTSISARDQSHPLIDLRQGCREFR